jgi:thioester reductase-like protein
MQLGQETSATRMVGFSLNGAMGDAIKECLSDAIEPASDVSAPDGAVSLCVAAVEGLGHAARNSLCQARRLFPLAPILLIGGEEATDRAWINEGLADAWIPATDDRDVVSKKLRPLLDEHHRLAALSATVRSAFADKHLLLTGGTGFLGSRLVWDLLRCTNASVTLLQRPETKRPKGFLPGISDAFDGRIQRVTGSITLPDLGLSSDAANPLRETVDEFWHIGAVTDFEEILRERIFRANVTGTENALAFASGISHLKRFIHVSTAFTAGKPTEKDPVRETLHAPPISFRNPYEESKHIAEQRVADSGLPWLLLRPSILVGDLLTGRSDGKTIYNVAKAVRLASLLRKRREERFPGSVNGAFRVALNPNAEKNLIPVDMVSELMLRLRANAKPKSIFHLSHPQPILLKTLVNAIAEELQLQDYCIVENITPPLLEEERVIQKLAQVFHAYMMKSDPKFSLENTLQNSAAPAFPTLDHEALRNLMACFFTKA